MRSAGITTKPLFFGCLTRIGLAVAIAALCRAATAATIPVPDRPPDLTPRITGYQPRQTLANCGRNNQPWVDRHCFGWAVRWNFRAEDWHCAVSSRVTPAVPLGTVLVIGAPVNRIVLACDTGPGVRSNQVDICYIWANEMQDMFRQQARLRQTWANVWVVGRVPRAQARNWRPEMAVVR